MGSLEGSRPTSQQGSKSQSILKPVVDHTEDIQSRSSLGLVAVDQMDELSSSVLHFDMCPVKKMNNKPSIVEEKSGDHQEIEADIGAEDGASGQDRSMSTRQDMSRSAAEGLGQDILNIVRGGMAFAGRPSQDGAASKDLDASVVDVKINADELEQLDDDFSDVGDFDDTITSELPENLQNEPPDGAASGASNTGSIHSGMQASSAGLRRSDILGTSVSNDSGITSSVHGALPTDDDPDVEIEALGQRMEAMGERAEDQLYGRDGVGSEDQGFHARIHNSFPRQSDAAGVSRLDSRYFRESPMMHCDGDGQEDEDLSLYPRQSTIFDDPSVTAELTRQGPAADHPRPPMVAQGRNKQEEQESSEIDTDDEIAAVRQENAVRDVRQRGVGTSMDGGRDSRPGLEGGSSEENDVSMPRLETRQSAEGDALMFPVPGDGGGGGDGSSGHSSDDDMLQGATGGMPQSSNTSSAHARDFLRDLGFLGQGHLPSQRSQFETDVPEEQQRVRPQGEDLMSDRHPSGPHRRVRFVSPANRLRMLSGASDDEEEQDIQQQDPPEIDGVSVLPDDSPSLAPSTSESFHISMYLAPTQHMSMASETSRVGLEESSFNLADLVHHNREMRDEDDDESGIGHADQRSMTSPQLSDQALFADHEDKFRDITFSQKISFENAGEFSQLQPTGSPFSDISDRTGSKDSRSSSQLMPPPPPVQGGKLFVADDSPVYINEEGESVTELAYYHPFVETGAQEGAAYNPFDTSAAGAVNAGAADFSMGVEGEFGDVNFSSDEFKPADKGVAMFDEDEEEFKKEHMFDQGDAMQQSVLSPTSHQSQNTADSLVLPDSWSLHSAIYTSHPSLMDEMDEAASRISIGAFMGLRTEVLGSLDDTGNHDRPHFGTKIVTPPGRRPVPLIDHISPPLSYVHEGQGQNDDPDMEVRGSGVGSDVDVEVGNHAQHPQQQAAGATHPVSPPKPGSSQVGKHSKTRSNVTGTASKQDSRPDRRPGGDETQEPRAVGNRANTKSFQPSQSKSVHPANSAQQSNKPTTFQGVNSTYVKCDYAASGLPEISDDDDEFEAAGNMDIGAISKLILAASDSAGSEDLVDLVMKVSKTSSASTERSESTSSQQSTERGPPEFALREVPSVANQRINRQPDGKPQIEDVKNKNTTKSLASSISAENQFKVSQRDSSPASRTEDIDSLHRKSAEGKAEDDPHKKFKGSKIPTFGGRKHPKTSTRSERHGTGSNSELDSTTCEDKENKKEGKPPVGKVEPMPSLERDDFNTKRRSPHRSPVMTGTTEDNSLPLSGQDFTNVTGEVQDALVIHIDLFSASQHERHEVQEDNSLPLSRRGVTNATHDEQDTRVFHGLSTSQHEPQEDNLIPLSRLTNVGDDVQDTSQHELREIRAENIGTSTTQSPPNPLDSWEPEHSTSVSLSRNTQTSLSTSAAVPTLLTSRSLSTTPFASQYLSTSTTGPLGTHHMAISTASTASPSIHNFNSSPYAVSGRMSNLTPVSAMSSSRLSCGFASPLDQHSTLDTYAVLSHGTLSTTGMTTLAEPSELSRHHAGCYKHGQAADLAARLNFADRAISDHPGSLMHTAPAGTGYGINQGQSDWRTPRRSRFMPLTRDSTSPIYPEDKVLAPSSLHRGAVSISTQLPSRTVPLSTDEVGVAEVPHELYFEEVCCVGLSSRANLSIRNSSSRWLQVRTEVVTVMLDGRIEDPNHVCPFLLHEKCIIEPKEAKNVTVLFAPREPGNFVAKLQIDSSLMIPDQPLQTSWYRSFTTLSASAEPPNIQVLTEGQDGLDFGAVQWGCSRRLPITLINKGRANTPVRLAISSSSWHCFSFEKSYGSSNTSVNTGRPRAPSPSVVNVQLPAAHGVHISPVHVVVNCKTPTEHLERTSGPPEKYHARIEVQVESPSTSDVLACVDVFAVAGTFKLHTPRDMEYAPFRAEVGRSDHKSIPLRNVGNLPLEVTLEVTHWPDFFAVIPMKLRIEPGCEQEVIVRFQPKHANVNKLESVLLMCIEPDGQSYEMELVGEVSLPLTRQSEEGRVYANKEHLTYGGVQVGRALEQSVTLKNMSENITKLKLLIRGSSSEFQIQSAEGVTSYKDLILKSREEFPVLVLFAPSSVATFCSKLQIRQETIQGTLRSAILLTGYGGVGQLELEGMNKAQGDDFWTSIGRPKVGQNIITKVNIKNSGDRAAYVKALPFKDLGCKETISGECVTIQPSEICLKAKQTKAVVVVFSASTRESSLCQERAAVVATVAFFYGDEINRQKYRKARAMNKKNTVILSETNPVRGVNFDVTYQDEDLITEGAELRDTPNDIALFHYKMNKVSLALVGESFAKATSAASTVESTAKHRGERLPSDTPPVKGTPSTYSRQQTERERRSSSTPLKSNRDRTTPSTATRSLDDELLQTAVQESKTSNLLNRAEDVYAPMRTSSSISSTSTHVNLGLAGPKELPPQNVPGEFWNLRPNIIILPGPNAETEPVIKRVQIINYTERVLSYECSWPAHCVTLTPEEGAILPRSNVLICISPNSAIRRKGISLPWKGQIIVYCDGTSKAIRVQIRDDVTSDYSVIHHDNASRPLTSENSSPMIELSAPSQRQPATAGHIEVSRSLFSFSATRTGRKSELPFEITNTSPYPVKWVISSFAPPYVKEEESQGVYRVMYPVFSFLRQTGLLMPEESTKVLIIFSPREVGHYSQFWEVKTQSEGMLHTSVQTMKLELMSQGIQEHLAHTVDSLPLGGTVMGIMANRGLLNANQLAQTAPAANKPSLVSFRKRELDFPLCKVGKRQQIKAEVRNKDTIPQVVELATLKHPFYIREAHTKFTIHPSKYVCIPIEFRPDTPGRFQGLLVANTTTDNTSMILRLSAQAES